MLAFGRRARVPLTPPDMRTLLRHKLLAALLVVVAALGGSAHAGTVAVDTTSRIVETSRLKILFDHDTPDFLPQIFFKDFSQTLPLTTYNQVFGEFWGQSFKGTSRMGFSQLLSQVSGTWQVTSSNAGFAEIVTTTQSVGQPVVSTTYRFFADQPFFTVDRTIRFSTLSDTAAYQPYAERISELYPYRAVRWRDSTGTLVQRGFCITPCVESGWDRHWIEQYQQQGGTQFAIVTLYPASMPSGLKLVRGRGTNTQSTWCGPLVPAGMHATDATWSRMVLFSTNVDRVATFDSLYAVYNAGTYFTDVPAGERGADLSLSLSPNPARGATRIAWSSPAAGAYALEVIDVAGRRIATLGAGWAEAGAHAVEWNGRDDAGRTTRPGLYFVRLAAAGGTRITRLVRTS